MIWRGYIKADYSEPYTFRVNVDDEVWIYIDGQEVLHKDCCAGATSAPFSMQAGVWKPIEVRYRNKWWKHDWLDIWWSSSSQAEQYLAAPHLRYCTPP